MTEYLKAKATKTSIGIADAIRDNVRDIATVAAQIGHQNGPKGYGDKLLRWKVRTDFGTYTITVACRYRKRFHK